MPTVYIDELFILNAVINFILLFVTKRIIRSNSSNPRLFLGSVIGAIYAIFMFLPSAKFIYSFVGKLIFSLVLVAITYDVKKFKKYIRAVGVFYLVSFVFGGSAYAILSFTSGNEKMHMTLKILVTSTVIAYIFITFLTSYYKRLAIRESKFTSLSVFMDNKSACINCLIDTGNSLYEPLSDLPVIVVEFESICCLLPNELCDVFRQRLPLESIYEKLYKCDFKNRLRLIPFHSLGSKNGMIIGFKPDKVTVNNESVGGTIIGIYAERLSSDNSYSALINPQVFA